MKKHLTGVGFALAALLVLAGCGGPVKYPNYYTLHLPPPPDPPAPENVRATLAIREFRSPDLPSARGHCVQDLSGTDRLLQLPPLGGGSA